MSHSDVTWLAFRIFRRYPPWMAQDDRRFGILAIHDPNDVVVWHDNEGGLSLCQVQSPVPPRGLEPRTHRYLESGRPRCRSVFSLPVCQPVRTAQPLR